MHASTPKRIISVPNRHYTAAVLNDRRMKATSSTLEWALAPAPPARQCAWCDREFDEADDRRSGRVWCARCGVATTSPWPNAAQLAEAYGDWYRPANGRFSGLGDQLLRRTRAALAGRLDPVIPPGPVLDVGAGDGTLVDAFLRRGREAVGLEPYASGPHIRNAEIEEMSGAWAAVIFWHSLEHLRQPAAALRHAAKLLVPGGQLVIAVPNAASLQARVFGDRWFALDLPRHLVHLRPEPLLSEIEALGLSIERVSYVRGGQIVFGWVHGLVSRLPGQPDLYEVVRRGEARRSAQSPARVCYALAAAGLAVPLALAAAAAEVAARSGGTIYVQARRHPAPGQAAGK
jgi:SAM-dependent methyltransferase